ncbi:peptidase C39 family protein [Pseudoroseomonas globiformis]|uniref:Peptidase C39 family protein n=1 Tax=Teichococcus globiformis TaxID=2307229 RepID=A0ABV7G2L8_9PROT
MAPLDHIPAPDELARAMAALPPERREEVAATLALPGHHLACLWEEGTLAGLALGLARPTGGMMRLLLVWIAPGVLDRTSAALVLAERLADQAKAVGLLGWRRGGGTVIDAELLPAFGVEAEAEHWFGNLRLPVQEGLVYYRQSTRFTCGPASLLMAMRLLQGEAPTRDAEIALWREATSIVSLSGPGGCDPFGLALAARRRGLQARVLASTPGPMLMERADTEEKRDLIRFVQEGFRAEVAASGLQAEQRAFEVEDLAAALDEGAMVLVLVSQTLTQGRDTPHWILLHGRAGGAKDGWFLISDPWTEPARGEGEADARALPVNASVLDRMAWYGEPPYRTAVVLRTA